MTDGYLCRTFGSHRTETYIFDLLRSNSINVYRLSDLTVSNRGGHFFFIPREAQRFGTAPLLLDRAYEHRGSVVPQTMWYPLHHMGLGHSVLQMPIFFEREGRLGISLEALAAGQSNDLRDAHEFVPLGFTLSSYNQIRICVSIVSSGVTESLIGPILYLVVWLPNFLARDLHARPDEDAQPNNHFQIRPLYWAMCG